MSDNKFINNCPDPTEVLTMANDIAERRLPYTKRKLMTSGIVDTMLYDEQPLRIDETHSRPFGRLLQYGTERDYLDLMSEYAVVSLALIDKFCADENVRKHIEDGVTRIDDASKSRLNALQDTAHTIHDEIAIHEFFAVEYSKLLDEVNRKYSTITPNEPNPAFEKILMTLADMRENGIPTSKFTGESLTKFAELSNEIGIRKQQVKDDRAGMDRAITKLKAENNALKRGKYAGQ